MSSGTCAASSPHAAINRLARFANEERPVFLAFIAAQWMSADLAEDVLQRSLLKAIEGAHDLRSVDRLESWFYQIVRNVIHDGHRRLATERHALETYARESNAERETDQPGLFCPCVRARLLTLRAQYRCVIEEL